MFACMDSKQFGEYIDILQKRPFALHPAPGGIDFNRFTYVDDDSTHVRLENERTKKRYQLPLVLVEFANEGVLRLTRTVEAFNGGFV